MTRLSYLLAGLMVALRVYVPVSMTVAGGWPVRLVLFILWYLAITSESGNKLGNFYRTLETRRSEIACYAIWLVILVFVSLIHYGEDSYSNTLLTAYGGMAPFYFLGTYYSVIDVKGRRMALALMVLTALSCLQAIPVIWQNPGLVREGAITANSEIRGSGIGSYGDITGFTIALPFFITISLQSTRLTRIVGVGCCCVIIALSMIATFSGVILLTGMSLVGCGFYYLLLRGFRLIRIIVAAIIILGAGLTAGFVFPSVYYRQETGQFYDKLQVTIATAPDIITGQAYDPTSRYDLMLRSKGTFLENPMLGAALRTNEFTSTGVGGHSSWMDALATYGLFGGGPYLLFHILVFRRNWRTWRRDHQNALYWGCLLSCTLYIFYGLFNVTTQSTTIALFLYVTAASNRRTKVSRDLVD